MRITVFLLLASILQTFANDAYSQKTRLSLDFPETKLVDVLDEIESKTEFFFLFNEKLIDTDRKVNMSVKNEKIDEILDNLFEGTDVVYTIIDRKIILAPSFLSENGQQQNSISGTVTDEAGQPLPGVTVLIKGTTNGTVTNVDGIYNLSNITEDATLKFSFIGMKTQEIIVGGKTTVDVIMTTDAIGLEEVVAIGYGTAKRKEFTGSVSSVRFENSPVALAPNTNALESLKGNVTGLNIGASNTAGGEPSMQIRGQNSINGSNDPLIVLDGIIFMGSLSDINPNDIANVDVLKDAVSASVYGSRAANGVIAITTKRGKSQKPVISFNTSTGIQTYWENRELIKGQEWLEAANRKLGMTNLSDKSWLVVNELENWEAGREVDWIDEVTRLGVIQDYQLSISGAGKGINYYLSTALNDNKGVVVGDDFSRISVLGKIETEITKWLKVGVDAAYSKRDYSGYGANLFNAQRMTPYGDIFRDDLGNLEKWPYTESQMNPLWGVNDGTREDIDIRENFRLNAFALVKIPWVKGLSYRLNYSQNLDLNNSGDFTTERYFISEGVSPERYEPSAVVNYLSLAGGTTRDDKTNSYVWDNIINYKNSFGNHIVDITAVYTQDELNFERVDNSGTDFAANGNTALGITGLHKASVQTINYDGYKRANIGYLIRGNYSFNNKYFISGSFRRDGASVFGADKKWANFAGVGLAWNITNEDFLDLSVLDNLKLKVAFGQNGNQGVGPYSTLSQINNGVSAKIAYEFASDPGVINYGLRQANLGNDELGWEKTGSWNIGFESEWLNSRLFLDLDAYASKTTDQIFARTIPSMTGFSSVLTSLGRVDNKGLELTLRSINIQKNDFSWSSALTFWKNWNKIVELYGEDLNGDGVEDDDIASGYFIGHSLGAIYGYEQIGVVQENDTEYMALTGASPGFPKYNDIDGEPGISATDRKILGYTKPNYSLNLSNTLAYKDFELYFMFQGIFGGNDYYLKANPYHYLWNGNGSRDNSTQYKMNYWSPENKSNEYLIPTFMEDNRFLGLQSRGFVRLQDLSVSYRFNQPWVNDINISNLKVFMAVKNLITITNWKGDDPELGSPERSGTYPSPTIYSLGLNVSF